LKRAVDGAGPAGWLTWTVNLRNSPVHRPRRLAKHDLVARPVGASRVDTEVVFRVPAQPDLSDIEVFASADPMAVLPEDASSVLQGCVESTRKLALVVARQLLAFWTRRRGQPVLVQQPAKQWPSIAQADEPFAGFASAEKRRTSRMIANPILLQRITAAGLDGPRTTSWTEAIERQSSERQETD
jgi:hypothetical protein